MKLYLAYGANTNHSSMAVRCPTARYVCNVTLNGHRLVFRGVADVVPAKGQKLVCAMWVIGPKDEEALDRFEGFPNLYVKRYVTIHLQGKRHRVMFYVMRSRFYEAQPSKFYEETLRGGYAECGMPLEQIDAAINQAKEWEAKHPRTEPVRYGSWADKPQTTDLPTEDEAAQADAADQFMFDWYNDQKEEK